MCYFYSFSPDPTIRHTWFTLIIGGGITFLSLYAVNQTQVQRYLTVKDLKTAQKALWLNWPILTCLSISTSYSGLVIYSRYHSCDPVRAGIINTNDQVDILLLFFSIFLLCFEYLIISVNAVLCSRYNG